MLSVKNLDCDLPTDLPLRVGIVGTGFAAKLRAEALQADPRAVLVAVAGGSPDRVKEFAQPFGVEPIQSCQSLFDRDDIDLIFVTTINQAHAALAEAALTAGKHVVVEYPLALHATTGEALINLARQQRRLLHVEHIERLGGLHQALIHHLPAIGRPLFARYSTITPQRPAPRRWTYHAQEFGFPFGGALSRLHRFTHAFGEVEAVGSQIRYWDGAGHSLGSSPKNYFATCFCQAQLRFRTGLIAELTYGKGEHLWREERLLEVHGDQGALIFDGDNGQLVQDGRTQEIEIGPRRGLFVKDTTFVLDFLTQGTPLYLKVEESLYALRVANAIQTAAETETTVYL